MLLSRRLVNETNRRGGFLNGLILGPNPLSSAAHRPPYLLAGVPSAPWGPASSGRMLSAEQEADDAAVQGVPLTARAADAFSLGLAPGPSPPRPSFLSPCGHSTPPSPPLCSLSSRRRGWDLGAWRHPRSGPVRSPHRKEGSLRLGVVSRRPDLPFPYCPLD